MNGHRDVAELLIEKGADMPALADGKNALYLAARYNHIEIVKMLISACSDGEEKKKQAVACVSFWADKFLDSLGKADLKEISQLIKKARVQVEPFFEYSSY